MLREFTSGDQASVRELVLEGMRERWGAAYDPAFNSDLDDIVGNYVDHGADVVVIEIEGEVVATGMLLPDADGTGRIVRMAVGGERRRQGLGRLVVEELVRPGARSMSEVRVHTDAPWTSAVELYLSAGFVNLSPP